MQTNDSIYNHPVLYDTLFSASCSAEIKFLLAMLNKHCGKIIEKRKRQNTAVSFFEPACGTGRLLWRLKKIGFDTAGLDLNPNAVDYCNKRFARHGFTPAAAVGNMADFSLSNFSRRKNQPFDTAFNFVSSFLHLTKEKDALPHLRLTADCLSKDGLYILGIHLLPKCRSECQTEHWLVRHGNLTLQSALKRKSLDLKKRLETVEFKINAYTPKKNYTICDTFQLRTYTLPQIMRTFAAANCFDILETFDFNLAPKNPIVLNEKTEDVVFVLKAKRK